MRRISIFLCCVVLSGCMSMVPERKRPEPVLDFAWNNASLLGMEVDKLGWREAFPDSALQVLVTTALTENRDLRQAIYRAEKIREQYAIRRAALWPHISAQGTHSSTRVPPYKHFGEATISRQWSVGVGVMSFELDLFGRLRSLKDAALETYLASEEARRATQITLVSHVVQTYLRLAADRELLQLARDTRASRAESEKLMQLLLDNGMATDLAVQQAREAVAVAEAEEAKMQAQAAMDEHALSELTGMPVPLLPLPAQKIADIKVGPEVASGLPADLLTRRPDILAAEHGLWAAGAEIGAARANFFPQISLTTTLGFMSPDLSHLFGGNDYRTWNFSPGVVLPLFTAGQNLATLRAAEAEQKIRVAAYEKAIQTAFREVADALVKKERYTTQVEALGKRVQSAEKIQNLVQKRYKTGLESALALHDAERMLFTARQGFVQTHLAKRLALVELFVALGGGWQE